MKGLPRAFAGTRPNIGRKRAPDGREYWVDRQGLVRGVVRTGNPREDQQQYDERDKIEKLLAYWRWPADSSIERPGCGTYDYDCRRGEGNEVAAVEVKRVTLPEQAIAESYSRRESVVARRDFQALPAKRLAKANNQLRDAPAGFRRCALLVLDDEAPNSLWWNWLVKAVMDLDLATYTNVNEVWLTTSHLTRFLRAK